MNVVSLQNELEQGRRNRGQKMSFSDSIIECFQASRLRHLPGQTSSRPQATAVSGRASAWAIAEHHPEYVWKLAALQVPPVAVWRANMTFKQALRSWYMLFFQLPRVPEWWLGANDFARLKAMFKATARRGTFTETDLAVFKTALQQRSPTDETCALTGAINYYRANVFKLFGSTDERATKVEPRVRVPTLFIYGEQDHFVVPETVKGVGAYVAAPYAEVRFAHVNHWVQQEAPTEVSNALISFLQAE